MSNFCWSLIYYRILLQGHGQSGDIGAKIEHYGPLRGALFIGIRRKILGCPIPHILIWSFSVVYLRTFDIYDIRITLFTCFMKRMLIHNAWKRSNETHICDSATRLIAPFVERALIKPNPKQYVHGHCQGRIPSLPVNTNLKPGEMHVFRGWACAKTVRVWLNQSLSLLAGARVLSVACSYQG